MEELRWVTFIGWVILSLLLIAWGWRVQSLRPTLILFIIVAFHGALFQGATLLRSYGIYSLDVGVYNTWSALVRIHTIGTGIGTSSIYLLRSFNG